MKEIDLVEVKGLEERGLDEVRRPSKVSGEKNLFAVRKATGINLYEARKVKGINLYEARKAIGDRLFVRNVADESGRVTNNRVFRNAPEDGKVRCLTFFNSQKSI